MNLQILNRIKGSHALVGPALVYHDNQVSIVVAAGTVGMAGELTELILGELIGETPAWAEACDTVLTIRGANDVTMSEARALRFEIIGHLRSQQKKVEVFDTDIALAVAYADRFPSTKSRQVLNEVAGVSIAGDKIVECQPSVAPPCRTTSDAAERARLTPKLRYDVLSRDDFRCRSCGFGIESGAHLHIDHIHPISKGGLTEFQNLQALCSVCNQGKGARK